MNKLPEELFLKTFEFVPRIALDLLIQDSKGRILLTKRGKAPSVGMWHIPGSFLLKNEKISDCLKRIMKDELAVEEKFNVQLKEVYENISSDPRGHVIDIVYITFIEKMISLIPTGDTKEMKFFDKLPEDIGFNHADILHSLGYQ